MTMVLDGSLGRPDQDWRGPAELDPWERVLGLIDPAHKEDYVWPADMSGDMEFFSRWPEATPFFANHRAHLLTHHEENGNRVWSIQERIQKDSGAGLEIRKQSVHSFILTAEGEWYGEQHTCTDIFRVLENTTPTRIEANIKPLDETSLELFSRARLFLQSQLSNHPL